MFSFKFCEDIVNKDVIFMIILDVFMLIVYLLRKVYMFSVVFLRSVIEDILLYVFVIVIDEKDDVLNI